LAITYNAYWVPRIGSSGGLYPVPVAATNPDLTPWPTKLTDTTVNVRPILSDRLPAQGPAVPKPTDLGAGHALNRRLKNLNLLYGDGHVELRKVNAVQLRYLDPVYNWLNFY